MKKRPKKKIEKLKALIREKKSLRIQEREDEERILSLIRNPQPKIVMKIEAPRPSDNPQALESTKPLDTGKRPSSLEGYGLMDILLKEADGWLTKEEEDWLRKKPGRFDRRYIPPEKNRWMH